MMMMMNPSSITYFLLLLSSLPTSTLSQLDQTVYYIYQSASNRSDCDGNAVTIDGQIIGDYFSLQGVPPNVGDSTTCAEQSLCALQPTSTQCTSLTTGVVDTSQVSVTIREDGNLLECNSRNPTAGEQLCTISPPACQNSKEYPDCTYSIVSGQDLVSDPTILQNDDPQPIEEIDQTVYLMLYTDGQCTEFGALRGILQDSPAEFPIVNATVTDDEGVETSVLCEQSLACLLNPNGSSCTSLPQTGNTSTLTYEIVDGTKRICYGDETGEDCTHVVNSTQCIPSVHFPGW